MKITILSKAVSDRGVISITSDTPLGTIYYTLNGTEPTSNSDVYTEEFDYPINQTVKAIGISPDGEMSDIVAYQCGIPYIWQGEKVSFDIDHRVDLMNKSVFGVNITVHPSAKVIGCSKLNFDGAYIYPPGINYDIFFDGIYQHSKFSEGQVLYDSKLKKMKLYNGSKWVNMDGTDLE